MIEHIFVEVDGAEVEITVEYEWEGPDLCFYGIVGDVPEGVTENDAHNALRESVESAREDYLRSSLESTWFD